MDLFDAPLLITIGFNGPTSSLGADFPPAIFLFGGLVTYYT